VTLPPRIPNPFRGFGKRDIDKYFTDKYKRELSIPKVKIDTSLFDKLININTLGSDQFTNGKLHI